MSTNLDILLARTKFVYGNNNLVNPIALPDGGLAPRTIDSEGLSYWPAPHEVAGDCPEDCEEFVKHYRPTKWQNIDSRAYADEMDTATVNTLVDTFTRNIFDDLSYLRTKLETHGNVVFNRWTKKNEVQRRSLLQQATPDLFEKKAPRSRMHYG